jgi:hypothetical protein
MSLLVVLRLQQALPQQTLREDRRPVAYFARLRPPAEREGGRDDRARGGAGNQVSSDTSAGGAASCRRVSSILEQRGADAA